jgi:hypothetical protein
MAYASNGFFVDHANAPLTNGLQAVTEFSQQANQRNLCLAGKATSRTIVHLTDTLFVLPSHLGVS